ncbi:MAG: hypothetical protein Tsb005_08150 [Gammaproteobacteria bacterium]
MKKIMVLMALSAFLYGCIPVYETTYRYEPPTAARGKRCVAQCERAKEMCFSACQRKQQQCVQQQHIVAQQAYEAYQQQQLAQGELVERDLESFYNDKVCQSTCHECEEHYRPCYELCGGQVIAEKHCVKNC